MQIAIDLSIMVNTVPRAHSRRIPDLCDFTFSLEPKYFHVYSLCLCRQMSCDGTFFCPQRVTEHLNDSLLLIIIIIIIIINCNWVVTRWQWLFYMHTKCEIGY